MRVWIGAAVVAAALLGGCRQESAEAGDTVTGAVAAPPIAVETASSAIVVADANCRSRSQYWPWGRPATRTWTPRLTVESETPWIHAGDAVGAPFAGRLVQAWGEDYGEAQRTVIIEQDDGCRRQYRAASFADADRAVIDAEVARRPHVADPASYAVRYQDGVTSPEQVADGSLRLRTTQHFAFWYGNATDGDFARTIARQGRTMQQVLDETAYWFERQWLINRDVLRAPMPFAATAERYKLNVYLCGTGRPTADGDLDECGAGADEAMGISAWGLTKGSNVVTHEFGHMIQFYTGGFRDRPQAGPIWETGAQWNAAAVSPFNETIWYLNNLETGPLFSVARYQSYPWMTYLYEQDGTRDLIWRTWRENLRSASGASQEDWVETLVRLGRAAGVYPQGYASFADDMGWYGMRLVTMDFLNKRLFFDAIRATRTTSAVAYRYMPLTRVATSTDRTLFAPPTQRALLQWGTHLIPLTPSANVVKATLAGGTTANAAAWRFGIVAVAGSDTPTYSPLAKVEGTGSASVELAVPSGSKAYLVVTATPGRYESLGWQELGQAVKGTRFPYRVKITGATPRLTPVTACDPETAPGAPSFNYTLSGNSDAGRRCS